MSLKPKMMAPMVTGINKLKEKLKAFWGDKPKNKAEKIVPPERETAGKMAKA